MGTSDEPRGEGPALAGGQADEGLVEALDHAAGADAVLHALRLGVSDGLAVAGRGQVDEDDVAVGGGPVDDLEGAEALTQQFDALVDVGVGDLDGLDLDRDRREVGHVELGTHVDLGGDLRDITVVEPGQLDLRVAQRGDLVLGDGRVGVGNGVVDGLLEHRAAAEALIDQARRHLAAAEAGQVDLLGDLPVGLVDPRLEVGEGQFDGELHPGRVQLLDGARHWGLLMHGTYVRAMARTCSWARARTPANLSQRGDEHQESAQGRGS